MNRHNVVTIELKDRQTGYGVIGEYVRRYWKHNSYEDVVVCIAVSYNGRAYDMYNAVATASCDFDDVEFLTDWWEGEKFIKLYAIEAISELKLCGGIYEEE